MGPNSVRAQFRSNLARTPPISANAGPESTSTGSEATNTGPESTKLGSNLVKSATTLAQRRPNSANIGPGATDSGPNAAKSGPMSAKFGPLAGGTTIILSSFLNSVAYHLQAKLVGEPLFFNGRMSFIVEALLDGVNAKMRPITPMTVDPSDGPCDSAGRLFGNWGVMSRAALDGVEVGLCLSHIERCGWRSVPAPPQHKHSTNMHNSVGCRNLPGQPKLDRFGPNLAK